MEEYKKNFRNVLFENQFVTVMVNGYFGVESITYCGVSEIEGMRKYRELKGQARRLLRCNVVKTRVLETEMIVKYDILEVIKDEVN